MCGICGKVVLDRARTVEQYEIVAMRDTMLSRGPDAGGVHLDRQAGLGHRRLSIIDLEASSQPMGNEDGTVWIVFNGEIYNYRELRQELLARGHSFRTGGDTEVVIHLYEEYGEEGVGRLRGMFAFAIWDARSDTLLLARDRIGIKPLYYALDERELVFGSELKALLADQRLWEKREIDLEAMHGYLSFLCVPDPLCIYKGVRKLPAGHTLTLRSGKATLRRYWDVRFLEEEGRSEQEWCEGLMHLLREAVRIRLMADVPLGAFLSGGIDSSTIVAVMASLMDRPVKTFSIGFAEESYNEASDARRVAQHLGTDHTELILSQAAAREEVPRLLEHFDEPFADSSAIPTYFVSKLAREQVTVALSGDGGDELFGGYPWRQVRPWYHRLGGSLPRWVRSSIRPMGRMLPDGTRGKDFLSKIDGSYERYSLDSRAIFDTEDRGRLYAATTAERLRNADPYEHLMPYLGGNTELAWESRMMAYDIKTYLPNDILTKVDRMSMLVSLEARVPFLDHHLVEYAARIPARFKIRRGVAKLILKRAIGPYLPPEVMGKRKQGFSIPLESWLRTDLKAEVLDALGSANGHGFFDRKAVGRLLEGFFRGDDSANHQVWTLYAFELWYRKIHCGLGRARAREGAWRA